ncbi:MAG: hypothetical protein ACYS0H_18145, partial [Planctomycetota bacterium]
MLEATKRALASPRQPEVGRDIGMSLPEDQRGTVEKALAVVNRGFSRPILNAWKELGQAAVGSDLSPLGLPEEEVEKFMPQAMQEISASGFSGNAAQRYQLARSRAKKLAGQARIPSSEQGPPQGKIEKGADVVGGISKFVAQVALLKKAMPAGTPSAVIWETQNLMTGGVPGQGMVMRNMLGVMGSIPLAGPGGKALKVTGESALLGSVTGLMGGSDEDVVVSWMIPVVFNAWNFRQQRKFLDNYVKGRKLKVQREYNLNKRNVDQAYRAEIKAIDANPDASARPVLREQAAAKYRHNLQGVESEMRAATDKAQTAIAAAKRAIWNDDAFAPTRERLAAAKEKALKDVASKNPKVRQRGNDVLKFIESLGEGASQQVDMPTTRAGEAVEAIKEVVAGKPKPTKPVSAK